MSTERLFEGQKSQKRKRRSGREPWARRLRVATGLLLLALSTIWMPAESARAQTPMHEVTWAHASPGRVRRFVIYVSPVSGSVDVARQIDVGKPTGRRVGSNATRYFSAVVPGSVEEFVAVAAVGTDGVQSRLSAWAPLPPGTPGQPQLVVP